MAVVYEHDADADVVNILAVEDARSSTAAPGYRS
jgi:hypothetical protein